MSESISYTPETPITEYWKTRSDAIDEIVPVTSKEEMPITEDREFRHIVMFDHDDGRKLAPHELMFYCGAKPKGMEWSFTDAQHALLCIVNGSGIPVCPNCMQKLRDIMRQHTIDNAPIETDTSKLKPGSMIYARLGDSNVWKKMMILSKTQGGVTAKSNLYHNAWTRESIYGYALFTEWKFIELF